MPDYTEKKVKVRSVKDDAFVIGFGFGSLKPNQSVTLPEAVANKLLGLQLVEVDEKETKKRTHTR